MNNKIIPCTCLLLLSGLVLTGCGNKPSPETNEFTVTFDGNGGTLKTGTEKQKVKSASEIVPPTYERENYTFSKWDKDLSTLKEDTLVKAVWTENVKYTINVFGGEGSGKYDAKTPVTIKAKTVQGADFVNWTVDGVELSNESTYTFTPTKNMTIYANYTFGQYVKNIEIDTSKDFKILNLTDIQLHDGEDFAITSTVLDQLVEQENPDMIVFLGDLLNDNISYPSITNAQKVIEKIDSFNIPWAPILGNHDYEDYQTPYKSVKTTTSDQLISWYQKSNNCLFTRGPECGNKGKSNYIVNLVDKNTKFVTESLIFTDSRLSGLDDAIVPFYETALSYANAFSNKAKVPSVLFSHVAIPEYGDANIISKACEFRDITGSINRDPCDLASGTKNLFPAIKEGGSTSLVVCGHDHENAYYTDYEGVRLAYSMKSSNGDNYDNFAEIGGSVVTINNAGANIRYTKADIPMIIEDKGSYAVHPDTLGYWRYSGGKLLFNFKAPVDSAIRFSLMGTNIMRVKSKTVDPLGEWNRLTGYENITVAATGATAKYGDITKVENAENEYIYSLDLTKIPLNNSGAETAIGDETLRLVYFDQCAGNFEIRKVRYEFEQYPIESQVDLSSAIITAIPTVKVGDVPVKPTTKVELGGAELKLVDDILFTYSNNDKPGTGTLTVVPSGKGAKFYKGSQSINFQIEQGYRGEEFKAGEDYQKDITPMSIETDTLVIDFHFTSGDDTKAHLMFGNWTDHFGYFDITPTIKTGDYDGLTVTETEDHFIRCSFKLSEVTIDSGKKPENVKLVYLWKKYTTASGYIVVNPAQ